MLQYRSEDADNHAVLKNNLRLTKALDALAEPLVSLGAEASREWRTEAEAHLCSLIIAHEELGLSTEDAITAALAQFGDTQVVGRQVAGIMQQTSFVPNYAVSIALLGVGGLTFTHCFMFPEFFSSLSDIRQTVFHYLFVLLPISYIFFYGKAIASTKNRLQVRLGTALAYMLIQTLLVFSFSESQTALLLPLSVLLLSIEVGILQSVADVFSRYEQQQATKTKLR